MSLDYRTKKYNLTHFHQINGDSAKLCLKLLCRAWVGHFNSRQNAAIFNTMSNLPEANRGFDSWRIAKKMWKGPCTLHKHLVQLKRNNRKSSQYTGKDDENKNDKLLARVRPVKTGLTTSNSSPPERTVHKKSRHDNLLAKWWKADSPGSYPGSNPINSNFPWECNA